MCFLWGQAQVPAAAASAASLIFCHASRIFLALIVETSSPAMYVGILGSASGRFIAIGSHRKENSRQSARRIRSARVSPHRIASASISFNISGARSIEIFLVAGLLLAIVLLHSLDGLDYQGDGFATTTDLDRLVFTP